MYRYTKFSPYQVSMKGLSLLHQYRSFWDAEVVRFAFHDDKSVVLDFTNHYRLCDLPEHRIVLKPLSYSSQFVWCFFLCRSEQCFHITEPSSCCCRVFSPTYIYKYLVMFPNIFALASLANQFIHHTSTLARALSISLAYHAVLLYTRSVSEWVRFLQQCFDDCPRPLKNFDWKPGFLELIHVVMF